MSIHAISRPGLIATGARTLFGASGLLRAGGKLATNDNGSSGTISEIQPSTANLAEGDSGMTNEQLIGAYYAAWDKKEWRVADSVLADSFTFTSPNGDDHINKSSFKAKCWSGQVEFIKRFELESVLTNDTEGFVQYLCLTTKDTSFSNVEYFRFADGKISSIRVFFGGNLGYPSAAAAGKS